MNHKVVPLALLVLTLIGSGLGYLLLHPDVVGWCPIGLDSNCLGQDLAFGIGEPLYRGLWWLLPIFATVLFVRDEVFSAWWKSVLPIALVGLLFIVISPTTGSPLQLAFSRTTITTLVVQFVAIVSVLVIGWKYWRLSRINQTKI